MAPAEEAMLRRYLAKATHYFEFGSGGSTVCASTFANVETIETVESLREWMGEVQKHSTRHVRFHYVDINGDPHFGGHPRDQSKKDAWPLYSSAIAHAHNVPDTVLVDGRFRVASALQTWKASPDALVLVHDYVNRPKYHALDQFFERIEQVDTLVAFRAKKGVPLAHVEDVLAQHQWRSA